MTTKQLNGHAMKTSDSMDQEPRHTSTPALNQIHYPLTTPTPATLLQMAVQQGADLDRLEKLMALQERWENNEAKKSFTQAMAEFKANPPEIFKDKEVSYTGTAYSHATLGNVCSKIVAALARVGISHKWDLQQSGGDVAVTCVLTHRMGHSEGTRMESNADTSGKKNPIQAVASAISYLQRYTLLAATGLATQDQDDDAHASQQAASTAPDWVMKFISQIDMSANSAAVEQVWKEALALCHATDDKRAHAYLKKAVLDRLAALKAAA